MNLREYQEAARKTAIYPDQYKVAYPALGLVGELCELHEKFWNDSPAEEVLKEAGDCLWYCANLCSDIDASLSDLCLPDVDPRAMIAQHELGQFAETAKKFLRDGGTGKRVILLDFVYGAVGSIIAVANICDATLEDVAEMNIAKLQSRQERGVLNGDGDNR